MVAIFIYISSIDNSLKYTLKSLIHQKFKDIQIVLFTPIYSSVDSYLKFNKLNSDKIIISECNKAPTLKEINSLINYDFFIISNQKTISFPKRIKCQLDILMKKNLNCISALSLPNKGKYNDFIYKEQIDMAVSGGLLPLTLTSLLINRELLSKFPLNQNIKITDETSLLLEILKYSSIEKVDKYLYFYLEKYKNHDQLKIYNFNLKNNIEYRNYVTEAILTSLPANISINKERFTILMLINSIEMGGTESYILSLSKSLMHVGFNVLIATTGGIGTSIFTANNIKVLYISNIESEALCDLELIIKTFKVNLIHCHLQEAMNLGKKIYDITNTPYVITLHGMFYDKKLLANTCKKSSYIISVSEPIHKFLFENIDISDDKASIVFNGINFIENDFNNIRNKLSIDNNNKIITYCSRLSYGKGPLAMRFLKTVTPLLEKDDTLVVIILGEGTYKGVIDLKVNEINSTLKRRAIFLTGAVYNVKAYYNESELVIGTGRVILDAMSLSIPVIALGSQGLIGIVNKDNFFEMLNTFFGDHGFKDLSDGLSFLEMIQLILYNKDTFKKIAYENKLLCESLFNEKYITKQIVDIYMKIIKS